MTQPGEPRGLRQRGALLLAAALLAAGALAGGVPAASAPLQATAAYLTAQQGEGGGFAEQGRQPDGSLTSWAALGLVAADASPGARAAALGFLRLPLAESASVNDVALRVVAVTALGGEAGDLIARLRAYRPGGPLVNATIWSVIAFRAAGFDPPPALVQDLRATQTKAGGWSWSRGGLADSNDTSAAIQALRAARMSGAPVRRAVAFLRTFQNADGGFALTKGRASDSQSTAWAIQACLAAGAPPGKAAFRYLSKMRRADGSYRYSAAYATTPVWVTAQVLPALSGRWFPL